MLRSKLLLGMLIVALMLGTIGSAFAQGSTLVVWADDTRAPAILELSDKVEAELGVQLEVVELAFGDIRDQLLVAGPVGEGPDVLIGPHDWLGQLVSNGAIVSIELGDLAGSFTEASLNAFTFNGQLYGIPYGIDNLALIRNVDLVPEAPVTWEDVRTISEELQASGTAQYGFVIQTGDAYHAFPIESAYGGYIFGHNEDGSYNPQDVGFSSEGMLAAAQWMSGMYRDGLMPPNVDSDVALALFGDGATAMMVTGPWFSSRISESGINYSIDPLPGAEGGLEHGAPFSGAQGFMISAFSENQLLAEIFLTEYVATQEFMQSMFDLDPRPPAFIGVDPSTDPNLGAFVAAGTNAIPMPSIPEMGAVWSAAGNAQTLVSQGEDPIESYTNAQAQILEAIGLMSMGRIVGLAGSLQTAAGCETDWNPACEATFMTDEDGDGVYTITLTLPAGDYEYKIAMNAGWDESYGADGGSDNIALSLADETEVTFTFDDNTHIATDSVNNP